MLMNTDTRLLEALDIAALPEAEQETLLLELDELVFKGTMLRLVERMLVPYPAGRIADGAELLRELSAIAPAPDAASGEGRLLSLRKITSVSAARPVFCSPSRSRPMPLSRRLIDS